MNKKNIAGFIALGVVGYEANNYAQLSRALSYSISNFKIRKGSNHLILEYSLKVTNSSETSLPIKKVGGTIYYGGKRLANFETTGSVVLTGGETKNINLVSHINVSDGLNTLYQAMTKSTNFDIQYSVTATPVFLGFIPVPIIYKETLKYNLAPYVDVVKSIADILRDLKSNKNV